MAVAEEKSVIPGLQNMRTQGLEMNDDARGTIGNGGEDGRRGGEASRGGAFELRGGLSGGSPKAPRESRRNPQTGTAMDLVQSSQQESDPANWMTIGVYANG